jgi:hypothetical protein
MNRTLYTFTVQVNVACMLTDRRTCRTVTVRASNGVNARMLARVEIPGTHRIVRIGTVKRADGNP